MNKNTWTNDYTGVNSGLSKLAAADAKRQGFKFVTKAEKAKKKVKTQ
jgi:hypothetical protein